MLLYALGLCRSFTAYAVGFVSRGFLSMLGCDGGVFAFVIRVVGAGVVRL